MNLQNLVPSIPGSFWRLMGEVGKYKCLTLRKLAEDAADLHVDFSGMPDIVRHPLEYILRSNPQLTKYDLFTVETLSRLAADGPKLLKLTAEQCESFEHIEVNLTGGEYQQAYPTMLVQFPQMFLQMFRAEYPQVAVPDFIACRQYDSTAVYFSGVHKAEHPTSGENCLLAVSGEQTLEEKLQKGAILFPDEQRCMTRMYRVAINGMLMLTHFKAEFRPSNPWHLEQLKYNMRKRPLESTAAEIRTHVWEAALDQVIRVQRGERGELGDGTHASPHPHWRKGHWRMQAHGEKLSLRKRIFIQPVFVLKNQFSGDLGATSAEYR
jgi:hypothetical protein